MESSALALKKGEERGETNVEVVERSGVACSCESNELRFVGCLEKKRNSVD